MNTLFNLFLGVVIVSGMLAMICAVIILFFITKDLIKDFKHK